jgi:hypothetical protein
VSDWFEGDRETKAYLEKGAAEIWIVYPATRTTNVFRKHGAAFASPMFTTAH